MLSLSKFLSKNLKSSVSGIRSIYSAEYLEIDVFQKHCQNKQEQIGPQIESIKKNIEKSLSSPDGKVFVEDLKSFLYCSKSDSDIDLVRNSIERYNSQEKLETYSFNIPMIKLLTSLNKTDIALDILNKSPGVFGDSFKVMLHLINKLVEEQKYDEAIDVFKRRADVFFTKNVRANEILNLVSHALLEKNDAAAIESFKEIIKSLKGSSLNMVVPRKTTMAFFLTCIQQNQLDLAKEIAFGTIEDGKIKSNIKIMVLLTLSNQNLGEAIDLFKNLISINQMRPSPLIYKDTYLLLQKAIKESGKSEYNSLLEGLDEKLMKTLKEIITSTISPRNNTQGNNGLFSRNRGNFTDRNSVMNGNFRRPQKLQFTIPGDSNVNK
jgi:tetratricopeptide (TPR) repeat protein